MEYSLIKMCKGVTSKKDNNGFIKYYCDGSPKTIYPSQDAYIEILATSTKGTIGKLHSIEPLYVQDSIVVYGGITFILEVEGRKKLVRISSYYAKYIGDTGTTVYIRNVNKEQKKKEVPNPTNKFMQTINKGDWLVGTLPGKRLMFGRVTRWTEHNVWGSKSPTNDKPDFKFDSINETFVLPNEEHNQELLMATLKGWDGK